MVERDASDLFLKVEHPVFVFPLNGQPLEFFRNDGAALPEDLQSFLDVLF